MAKYIDITGQTFGLWKVIQKTDQRGADRSIMWECECLSCGKHYLINGSNLRNGHSSQGCKSCISHKRERKGKDISGRRFGLLVAVCPTEERANNGAIIWKCQCDCGNIKYVSISNLMTGNVQSCGCLVSKGEKIINDILTQNNIFFETQKKFKDCKDKDFLRFDFYVNNQYLIEFDGEQHFKEGKCWGNENTHQEIMKRDQIKNIFCQQNNIPLIRIPYWKLETLELKDLLLNTTDFLWEG